MRKELITFEVEQQIFGIDIMAVREIRAWSPTTRLPNVPDFVSGVVNLRGTVLPVVNLAVRLGWPAAEATARHVIIVTEFESKLGGWIVDAVSDIVTVPEDGLQPPPLATNSDVVPFLEGVATSDERMVMVLNLRALSFANALKAAA